jgi:hypothetical protein
VVPGVTSISFRVLSRVHMTHLGFGTSHFGLDGDPKRGCGGKNQLPNGGFAGAAASLLVLRVHVVTCLTSKADSGFTSKHAVIDVN